MDLIAFVFGLVASVTGLVSFINVNTVLELAKYFSIGDFALFAVVLSFARVPFEILSFTLIGAFNESTAVATSKDVQSFSVLLKQSAAAMFVALLLLPASTYVLALIWSGVKTYSILLAVLVFGVVAFKYFKKNILDSAVVVLLAGTCGLVALGTLSSSGLFPLLTGLYAIPVLLFTSKPTQKGYKDAAFSLKVSVAGAVGAMFASLLPATGVSIVAILCMAVFAIESLAFQSLVFSIYSARVVFDFANVYTISKARSMAATLLPYTLSYDAMFLLTLIGIGSFLLTAGIVHVFGSRLKLNLSQSRVKIILIALILLAVVIQTGPFGVLVLATSSAIGLYSTKCDNRLLLASSLLAGALSTLF